MSTPLRRSTRPVVLGLVALAIGLPVADHRANPAGADDGGTPAVHVSADSGAAETDAPVPLATPIAGDVTTPADEPTLSIALESQESGGVGIGPDNTGAGNPGASILYAHVVTNDAAQASVLNLTASSSLGWTVALFEADGVTLLGDHDGDGRPDTGELAAGHSYPVAVLVVVAADAWAGDVDVTTVTVSPAADPGVETAASNSTTVQPVLSLTVAPDELAFGRVTADGRVDPTVAGIVGQADEAGAYYVGAELVTVTVDSNAPWSGSCAAAENDGTAATVAIAGGRLEWRLAGTDIRTPFAIAGETTTTDGACFPPETAGTATFVYDVRLRVEKTDPPGTFSTRILFVAAP